MLRCSTRSKTKAITGVPRLGTGVLFVFSSVCLLQTKTQIHRYFSSAIPRAMLFSLFFIFPFGLLVSLPSMTHIVAVAQQRRLRDLLQLFEFDKRTLAYVCSCSVCVLFVVGLSCVCSCFTVCVACTIARVRVSVFVFATQRVAVFIPRVADVCCGCGSWSSPCV